jgi:siderophore synthetase component
MIWRDRDPDRAYIGWRVIDGSLRENLHDIVTRGSEAPPPPAVLQAWGNPQGAQLIWWRIPHQPGLTLWIPVRRSSYMQPICALSDGWVRQTEDGASLECGAATWLEQMAQALDQETRDLHRAYAEEAELAIRHRALSLQAMQQQHPYLHEVFEHPDWSQRLQRADQIASYRDHPYYPTARAKTGLDEAAMRRYTPEYAPSFELQWLAVPTALVSLSTAVPGWWPTMRDVGLPAALQQSHRLLPIHPLTWMRLQEFPLPEHSVAAPRAYLSVQPTLSVRTVMLSQQPDHHLKLPIPMYTLGALSLRLMRPSSLYDGYWFQQLLSRIAAEDEPLRDRYLHVDEAHFGHVEEARHLSYLLRRYPPGLEQEQLIPAAALCGPMPDGRLLAWHLIERYYAGDVLHWWRDYVDLLCQVHLRLWLVYGVALEANQQNTVLRYHRGSPPRLLMKDNDAARLWLPRLRQQLPDVDRYGPLQNERILASSDVPLGQMFCTIILQLNLLAVLEALSTDDAILRESMYEALRGGLRAALQALREEGIDTAPAHALLDAPKLPVKYLMTAGSLLSKSHTGAADIQKFYGYSAPNFMHTESNAPVCATRDDPCAAY